MKKLIKKLIRYDKIYTTLKDSFFYQSYKKFRSKIANDLYENPSKNFFVIWVTWTNWKTTVVNLLHKILNDNVAPTVSISTANIKIWNEVMKNTKKMTSLDSFDLQQTLATARASGCKIAVLETSSQWLDQYRFEWIKFDFAVLTNITMDHLDYHKTMDNYADAKKKLFKYVLTNWKDKKYAAFCTDDKIGKKWFEEMAFDQKISYSIYNSAVIKATKIEEWFEWTYFEFSYLGQKYSWTTQLIWSYNICNIMWAISVAVALGLKVEPVLKSIEWFPWVTWRMEPIYTNDVKYFVDFAHTPDWLEKTLSFASNRKWNWRLITICGAPWNRDKEKRPIMWEIATKYSDIIIFTDDDPDTENRLSVLNQLSKTIQEKWYPSKKKVYVIPERRYALQFATEIAKKWDIVVSCWKWHEEVQLTNFWKRKWNDKKVLTKILEYQHKTILNVNEIKKAYLQNLRIEKSSNSITTQQYYSQQTKTPQISTNSQNNSISTENSQISQNTENSQTNSWMFKRID